VVLAHGVLRVSRDGSVEETSLHWAYHFRAGRLWRQTTHASREHALEALSALRVLAEGTFTLVEDAGSAGERVIRLHGELDIDTVGELERVLLRSRPAEQRVVLDLRELQFMDSTGLRVLLRARAAAEEGRWEIFLRDVPSNIQRLFDMTGVHEALPAEAP
jgi:anti-anti-sigma factor